MLAMLTLLAVRGPDQGRAYPLPGNEPQLVGRSTEALEIHDPSVSRRHAELTPDGERWLVRDLGSRHGTFVNGVRIAGAVALDAGDRLRCGESEYLVVREGDEVASARDDGTEAAGASTVGGRAAVAAPDAVVAALVARLLSLATEPTDAPTFLAEAARALAETIDAPVGALLATDAALESFTAPGAGPDGTRTAPLALAREAIRRGEILAAGDRSLRLVAPFGAVGGARGAFVVSRADARAASDAEIDAAARAAQVASLAVAARDRRDARHREERLALIGETVASLSHSIKNMLQGLRFGADAVDLALARGDVRRAQEGWPVLQRNLDRIHALALNMLAWAKERPLEPEPVRVAELLDEVRDLLAPAAGRRRVSIVTEAPADLPPAELDLPSVHQALTNLAMNAVEAAPERTGLVTLAGRYDSERDEILIRVRDNGAGVPGIVAGRLFEPFLSTKGQRGTGLGLAVARKIAERHGGRLELASTGVSGSEFVLALPASASGGDPGETRAPRGVRPDLYGGRFE
jgi:two-component system NtrC family sensor kinase